MEAFFYNTSSKETYTIQYIDFSLNGGGRTVTYQSADVPNSIDESLYWSKTTPNKRNLEIQMQGKDTLLHIKQLESFCYPYKEELSPPIINFKLANLPVMQVLFEGVSSELFLYKSANLYDFKPSNKPLKKLTANLKPYRAYVESLDESPKDSVGAFEKFKNYLKSRFSKKEEEEINPVIQEIQIGEFDYYRKGEWDRYNKTDLQNNSEYAYVQAKVTVNFIEITKDGSIVIPDSR